MVKVVFLHPDLGIGGAERLVIDAGLGLRSKGHDVHFVTSHHDPNHCFQETRENGVFASSVTVVGDWLPRTLFGGRFAALCAYFRMIVAALYLCLFSDLNPDVIFVDQISVCLPVLKLFKRKVLFYCHFPDQLLTQRENFLKKIYRAPLDWAEEKSTGMADIILVNSHFTAGIYHDTFKSLRDPPVVLYPSLNTVQFDLDVTKIEDDDDDESKIVFLSINRYERKKNLPLAIRALDKVFEMEPELKKKVFLIMAGGYDDRVKENIEHFRELNELVRDLKLEDNVTFLKSPDNSVKVELLRRSRALLYTPSGEHFGIVPVEAMYCELPVIAVNNGGPMETVKDGETGFLVPPDEFPKAMMEIIRGGSRLKNELGSRGRSRVQNHFSFKAFSDQLHKIIVSL